MNENEAVRLNNAASEAWYWAAMMFEEHTSDFGPRAFRLSAAFAHAARNRNTSLEVVEEAILLTSDFNGIAGKNYYPEDEATLVYSAMEITKRLMN